MPTQSTSPGVAIGSVVAAATTGALVAMGHRLGSAVLPFAAISAVVFHRTVTATDTGLVFAGLVFHVTFAFVWSFLFVFLVRRARWRGVAGAIVIAVGELVTSWIVTLSDRCWSRKCAAAWRPNRPRACSTRSRWWWACALPFRYCEMHD